MKYFITLFIFLVCYQIRLNFAQNTCHKCIELINLLEKKGSIDEICEEYFRRHFPHQVKQCGEFIYRFKKGNNPCLDMGFCHKDEISFSSSSSSSFTSQPTHQPSSPSKQYYESTKQESDYKHYFSDYKKAPPRENADDLRKQLHEIEYEKSKLEREIKAVQKRYRSTELEIQIERKLAICKKEIESLRNTKRITIERIEASKNLIQYACKTNPDLNTCEELRNASSDILKPTPRSQYYTKNSKNTSIFGSFSTNKPKLYLIFVIFGFCIEIAEPLLKNYIELHHSGNRIMLEQATQVYLLIHHSFIIILGLFGLSEWKILLRISTENYSSQVSRITVLVKTIISLELGYRLGWIMKRYQTLGPHDLAQLLLTLMFILSRSDWRGYAVLIFIDYCCAAPECIFRLYFMNQLPSLRTILYIARTILVFWFLIWVGSMGVFSAAFGMFGLGQVVVYSWTFREILYKMGTFRWLFPSFDFSQNAYYSGYGNENTYNTDDRTSY